MTELPFAESIQARMGEVSAVASANAPYLYFDGAPTMGFVNGVANITLEANRYYTRDGEVVWDRVLIAHLRCPLSALKTLKEAIAHIERITETPKGEVN